MPNEKVNFFQGFVCQTQKFFKNLLTRDLDNNFTKVGHENLGTFQALAEDF